MDQDLHYPDLVQDSEDEDDKCNEEEEDEGDDKKSDDENGSASDMDSLILYSLIPIYCIHWFRFILQCKKQSIPTKFNPTDSTKLASTNQDLLSGFINYQC